MGHTNSPSSGGEDILDRSVTALVIDEPHLLAQSGSFGTHAPRSVREPATEGRVTADKASNS
jgi:hypothetical protein